MTAAARWGIAVLGEPDAPGRGRTGPNREPYRRQWTPTPASEKRFVEARAANDWWPPLDPQSGDSDTADAVSATSTGVIVAGTARADGTGPRIPAAWEVTATR